MNKEKVINYLIALTRIYLALVFIVSGLDKINNLDAFAISIENYRLFPTQIINIFAITIPWIELISGAFLLLGIYIKENSIIIASLLVVFTTAVIIAVARGLDIDCGCQGTFDGQKVGLLKIIENVSLFIVAYLSMKFPRQVLTFIKQ
ncbi:MAG: DoxX family membrane protein, partial [Ignavibacteriae bacterium]|nr:DoxX family membrane protein [Ignavibacteriota bacterium]